MTQCIFFETAIGWGGLAWGAAGLVGVQIPEPAADEARRAFRGRFPEAVEAAAPPKIEAAIAGVRDLLSGAPADLTGIEIDIARVPEFNAQVYAITRAIPPGETLTYGEIAVRLGDRLLARDVGAALGQNPWPIVVPCHRVTAAGGKLGGFSARGGVNTKVKLLTLEGAKVLEPAPPKTRKAPAPDQGSLFSPPGR